jgi:hypothetical protein
MTSQRKYQIRFDLNDSSTPKSARGNLRHPALVPLIDILAKHHGAMKCQLDALGVCRRDDRKLSEEDGSLNCSDL